MDSFLIVLSFFHQLILRWTLKKKKKNSPIPYFIHSKERVNDCVEIDHFDAKKLRVKKKSANHIKMQWLFFSPVLIVPLHKLRAFFLCTSIAWKKSTQKQQKTLLVHFDCLYWLFMFLFFFLHIKTRGKRRFQLRSVLYEYSATTWILYGCTCLLTFAVFSIENQQQQKRAELKSVIFFLN